MKLSGYLRRLEKLPQKIERFPKRATRGLLRTPKRLKVTILKLIKTFREFYKSRGSILLVVLVGAVVALSIGILSVRVGFESPVAAVELPYVDQTVPLNGITVPQANTFVPLNGVISLITFPLVAGGTYLVLRRRAKKAEETDEEPSSVVEPTIEKGPGFLTRIMVRTGVVQLERIAVSALALFVGLAVATALLFALIRSGSLPPVTGRGLGVAVGIYLAAFMPITILVFSLLRRRRIRSIGSELVVIGVTDRAVDAYREIEVGNRSDQPIDLEKAKITDAEDMRYRLGATVVLEPGETETFSLPATFKLEPIKNVIGLPFGLEFDGSDGVATIYTRAGDTFELNVQTHPDAARDWRSDRWRRDDETVDLG
jgi:hypothetical protein